MMAFTLFDLAQRFVGVKETPGTASTPLVLAMLQLDDTWPTTDAVPWCSGFLNFLAWLLRLPRSKSLAARSWLHVGRPITLEEARPENDIVILKRGATGGHVGVFAGLEPSKKLVLILGGNQSDAVNITAFPIARVIGVRRLAD